MDTNLKKMECHVKVCYAYSRVILTKPVWLQQIPESLTFWSICPFTDVDECDKGIHNCTDECVNTPGGFRCRCSDGYQLEEDGVSCKGVICIQ